MKRQMNNEIKLRSAAVGSRPSGTTHPGVLTEFFARISGVTMESASSKKTDG